MDQAIYTAASGALAMETKLAIISNNIANVSTAGFKKDYVSFEKYLRPLDTNPLVPVQYQRIPEDVITRDNYVDVSQGDVRQTSNPLDVALIGEGYLVVSTNEGLRYTRAGSFQRNQEGYLADQEGNPLQSEGGSISIGNGTVVIGRDGTVTVDGTSAGRLQVVTIPPDALVKVGRNHFNVKPGVTPVAASSPVMQQGAIELSNVNAVQEMLGLIETQRAYEAFQKMMRTVSDAYGLSIRNVGM